MTDAQEPMNEEEFDNFLLNMLKQERFTLLDLHGEIILEWYTRKDAGPLLLFVADSILDPDYPAELQYYLEGCYMFAYSITADTPENNFVVITLSHKEFDRALVFGQEFTADQFDEHMALATAMQGQ